MRSTLPAVLLVALAVCWTASAASHPLLSALRKKARAPSQPVGTTCSDGYVCPGSDSTCCPTPQGYGCCPRPNAVCCSDGIHCCEQGYTCDLANAACVPDARESNSTKSSLPMMVKFESLQAAKPIAELQIRPCGLGYCDDTQSCCPEGCCPYYSGVCCYDNTCCPLGYKCGFDDKCY